jgi:hypothetical protein
MPIYINDSLDILSVPFVQPIVLVITISHIENRLRLHRTLLALSLFMHSLILRFLVFESVTRVQRDVFLLVLIDW